MAKDKIKCNKCGNMVIVQNTNELGYCSKCGNKLSGKTQKQIVNEQLKKEQEFAMQKKERLAERRKWMLKKILLLFFLIFCVIAIILVTIFTGGPALLAAIIGLSSIIGFNRLITYWKALYSSEFGEYHCTHCNERFHKPRILGQTLIEGTIVNVIECPYCGAPATHLNHYEKYSKYKEY